MQVEVLLFVVLEAVQHEAHVWRRAEPLLLRELPGSGDPQEKERCA